MKKFSLIAIFVVLVGILSSCTILISPANSTFASYSAVNNNTIVLYGVTVDRAQSVTIDATCNDAGQSYNLYLQGHAYLNQIPRDVTLRMDNGDTFNSLTIYCSFWAINSITGRYIRINY